MKIKVIVEQGLWEQVTTLPDFQDEIGTDANTRPRATAALNLIIKARDRFGELTELERTRLCAFYDQLKIYHPELGLS